MKTCAIETKVNGAVMCCNRHSGHAPPHVLELFRANEPRDPHWMPTGGAVLVALPEPPRLTAQAREPSIYEVLDTLTYWHDQGHIDESWWEAARAVLRAAKDTDK